MAKRETLLDIADRLEGGVRDAFLASVDRITSDVQLSLLIEAIEAQDVPRVLALLNLERGYFAPLDRGLTAAYQEAGDAVMSAWVAQATAAGAQVRAVFDARNPRAEEWLRSQSSRLIAEITDDAREAVRAVMARNIEVGTAPRKTALDLIGRINRVTGKREGGIIGLGSQREGWAAQALEELKADPTTKSGRAQLQKYLGRKARDRRFDSLVMRAIRDEKPVSGTDAERIIQRYRDRLLRNRGEMIARTELLGSVHAAQDEGLAQMIESGKVSRQNIEGTWDAQDDKDTRPSHAAMDGQKRLQGEAFVSGNGNRLLYPGDRSQGAPGDEIIQCRCIKRIDIDWIAQAAQEARAA